jgi:hypothetical protein
MRSLQKFGDIGQYRTEGRGRPPREELPLSLGAVLLPGLPRLQLWRSGPLRPQVIT